MTTNTMKKELFKSLLADIELKNSIITDYYGNTIEISDYLEKCFDLISAKQEAKLIPYTYDNPLGIQLELTSKCNQHCLHCYNQSGSNECTDSELTIKEWKQIAKELADMGVFQCVISGGEPTVLGDSVFEIMDILHQHGVIFVFISNGMLINE